MSKLWNRLMRSKLVRDVAKLVTGAGVGQILALGTLLVTGRLFGDEAFGAFAIFTSVVALVSPIAALRYDLAVVLPDSEGDARQLMTLSRRIILAIAVLVTVSALAIRDEVAIAFGDSRAANFLILCGLSIFFVSEINLFRYWMNRRGEYGQMARNGVLLIGGTGAGQIGLGAAGVAGSGALVFGQLFGQAIAWVRAIRITGVSRKGTPMGQPIRVLAKRYSRMPVLNGLNAIADTVRINGLNILIGLESVAALGQYNMAWRITMAPVSLINAAIGQVLFRRLARSERGAMTTFLVRVIFRLAAVGLPLGLLIFLISPTVFPLLLGSSWASAGEFARALSPWLALMLISSPISTVFIVTEWQGVLLAFSIVYAIVPLAILQYSNLDFLRLVTLLGWVMAGLLAIVIVIAIFASHSFDARSDPDQI